MKISNAQRREDVIELVEILQEETERAFKNKGMDFSERNRELQQWGRRVIDQLAVSA
jgi:hypothetical protein